MERILKIKLLCGDRVFDFYRKFLVRHLEKFGKPEFTDDPDFVFHVSHELGVLDFDCIRISFGAENYRPDFNISDYAIGFDHLDFGDRYVRYPLYLLYDGLIDRAIVTRPFKEGEDLVKRKFCSFLVSNGHAAEMRSRFYALLNEFKRVDSGGSYLNNIGYRVSESERLSFQSGYKFTICFENSSTPGYLTEKIFYAFAARTIPIYWGDPAVSGSLLNSGGGLNPESFVNILNFSNLRDAVEYVKWLDNDDGAYLKMLNQSPFIEHSHKAYMDEKLFDFFNGIFGQSYDQAFRRGFGQVRVSMEDRRRKQRDLQRFGPLAREVIRRLWLKFR
jgi:hypothetical protein